MTEEKTTFINKLRHITAAHPLISTIVFVLLVEVLFELKTFSYFIPKEVCQLGGTLERLFLSAIIICFIIFFMKNKASEVGLGFEGFKEGMKVGIVIIICTLISPVFSIIQGLSNNTGHIANTGHEWAVLIDQFLLYLSVGIFEEVAYRAVPINLLRNNKKLDGRKQVLYIMIVSSVIFGLLHLFNMVTGFDTPVQAIGRAINCIGAGMLYAAIYVRSGSLLAPIIVHTFWDFANELNGYLFIPNDTSNTSYVDSVAQIPGISSGNEAEVLADVLQLIVGFALMIIFFLIGLFIARKKKCPECRINAPRMIDRF